MYEKQFHPAFVLVHIDPGGFVDLFPRAASLEQLPSLLLVYGALEGGVVARLMVVAVGALGARGVRFADPEGQGELWASVGSHPGVRLRRQARIPMA